MTELVYWLIGINLVSFLIFGADKWKAKRGRWRIPEDALILLAVFGGSVGALAGMYVFRHKTRHNKFRWGIPLILLAQLALMYFFLIR